MYSFRFARPAWAGTIDRTPAGRRPRTPCRPVRCRSRRDDGRRDGDRGSASASSRGVLGMNPTTVLPAGLLSNKDSTPRDATSDAGPKPMTVYTVRAMTSSERGSQLSSPYGAIWLCLVGMDGSSYLHRMSPLADPELQREQVREICESNSWEEAGANCNLPEAADAQPATRTSVGPVKARFMEGSVDMESFLCPELGPLAAVIIGPEEGAWRLHELNVSSSRTGHTDRFICRERMGEGMRDRSAAYLTPVPKDAVVYGSGESAVIVSKEEASKLYSIGMQDYAEMKQQMLSINMALVGTGCGLSALIGGTDALLPFALGGMLGILYQYSLQSAVDALPTPLPKDYDENPMIQDSMMDVTSSAVSRALAKPPIRFLMTASMATFAFWAAETISTVDSPAELNDSYSTVDNAQLLQTLLTMTAGFMLHKVSLVAATLQPQDPVAVATNIPSNKMNE